jgi:hypothetical protein
MKTAEGVRFAIAAFLVLCAAFVNVRPVASEPGVSYSFLAVRPTIVTAILALIGAAVLSHRKRWAWIAVGAILSSAIVIRWLTFFVLRY